MFGPITVTIKFEMKSKNGKLIKQTSKKENKTSNEENLSANVPMTSHDQMAIHKSRQEKFFFSLQLSH